jgi:Fe-S-cluster containining protein
MVSSGYFDGAAVANSNSADTGEERRFACVSCGKCCDRGPEMELSEATSLADTFITSLIFKAHSLPLSECHERVLQWHKRLGSRLPRGVALAERRRHLGFLASRRRSERQNGREVYLTITAIVNDYGIGQCPALDNGACGIYDQRPLTCRTVPFHYSRPLSVLAHYLDQFVATPGYRCDTLNGPVVLYGQKISSQEVQHARQQALDIAKADRRWKHHLLCMMDDPKAAEKAGLPTYDDILFNTQNGHATLVPMFAAWRIAEQNGLITTSDLQRLCANQARLIKANFAALGSPQESLALLRLYESDPPA